VQTVGRALRIFQGLDGDELEWLEYQINQQIGLMPDKSGAGEVTAAAHGDVGGGEENDSEDASLLILSARPARPPTDTQWEMSEGAAELAFMRRGRLALGGLGVLVFVNLFWNGIVSIFVGGLWGLAPVQGTPAMGGPAWWGLFVFLLPFEGLGLFMLVALLHALGEPFHRTRWTFTAEGVERQNTWLGAGVRRRWPVTRLARLDLKRDDAWRAWGKLRVHSSSEEATYRIVLVTPDLCELCAIKGLTEGEARWMAQEILGHQAGWFG
jgi:hypothetical protein